MSRTAMGMSRSISIAAVLLSAAVALGQGQWQPEPSLNEASSYFGAAVDPCGNIYAVGGPHTSPSDKVERLAFDGSEYASEWTYVTPLPSPRTHQEVVSVNGFIYVIGGSDGTDYLASVVRYDVTTDLWDDSDAVPDMNVVRVGAGATVDKWGRIWVVGGNTTGGIMLDSVEIYDPARPELGWVFGPSLNQARTLAGVVTDCQGRIYAIGGYDGTQLVSVERFDPCDEAGGWVFLSDMPGPTSTVDEAVLGADCHIYVAGGWGTGELDRVVRYDVETDTWEPWTPLTQARSNLQLVLGANGRIFAIGGAVYAAPQTTVESLDTTPKRGDMNDDGVVDFFDIDAFVECLLSGGCGYACHCS